MRTDTLKKLKEDTFDLLVIGGGATGSGVALDAISRGLSVALVERHDFSSETSSRSTKLVHGGVRYLENAFMHFDPGELELVRDALEERGNLLRNAGFLAHPLPIVTPVYSYFDAAYLWGGLKVYDMLAHENELPHSAFISRKNTLQEFPMLKKEGLVGSLIYYDGQFDDARMNISIVRTAYALGSAVCNYIQVVELQKKGEKISGVLAEDVLTGEKFPILARAVVNATGPFADTLRKQDDPTCRVLVSASSGTHIVLPPEFLPKGKGILIPKTKDGRVVFVLPWRGKVLMGTTDEPHSIVENPKPRRADIAFILETVAPYYDSPPTKDDILSEWTGLRPLVSDPSKQDTSELSRDHVILTSESGLITIVGGKWTTYRKMAEDCVDAVIETHHFSKANPCVTRELGLIGNAENLREIVAQLKRRFKATEELAQHLVYQFGTKAFDVATLIAEGHDERLHPKYLYTDAEVIYAIRFEFAEKIEDVLSRRTRLSFLDKAAALEAIPKIAKIFSRERHWTESQMQSAMQNARAYYA